jgi:hypothetical protein
LNAATRTYLAQARTQGATATEAAAALAADPRFAERIYAKPALRGMFGGTLVGVKLSRAAANAALPDELRAGVERVLMTVGWEDGYLDTTDATHAAELRAGVAGLVAVGVLTDAEAAAFLALGGGNLLERLTAEEIAAHWAAVDAAAHLATLRAAAAAGYNAVVAAIDGGETDAATLTALFGAGLGE